MDQAQYTNLFFSVMGMKLFHTEKELHDGNMENMIFTKQKLKVTGLLKEGHVVDLRRFRCHGFFEGPNCRNMFD